MPASAQSVRPPRVRSVPPSAWSAGPQATELAAEAGLILDGWQSLIIHDQLGLREDGKWAAFEAGAVVPRQNGKGGIIEARKLAGLFLFGERLILYSAHQFKTAQEHFKRMKELVRNSDDLSRRVKRISEANGEEGIELYGEGRHRLTRTQRLLYLARSKGSGRGFTGDCNLFDEAQYLTGKQIAALFPTMSAVPNPQLLYYGTPPDPEESADGGTYWVSVRKRGHEGSTRLCWHEYSPPEGYDRTDRQVWYDTNPALGIRISEEFVESELAALTKAGNPAAFDRERLGEWPPDPGEGWRVIPQQDWADAADEASEAKDPIAFAVACNRERTWTSIAVAGARADKLRHVEIVDRRPGTGWVLPRLERLVQTWQPCALVIAPSSPAGSLIAEAEAMDIGLVKASTTDYQRASEAFYDGISGVKGKGEADPRIIRWTGRPDLAEALTEAVRIAEKDQVGDAFSFERDIEGDPSPLEAAALALWGWTIHGSWDYDVLDSVG